MSGFLDCGGWEETLCGRACCDGPFHKVGSRLPLCKSVSKTSRKESCGTVYSVCMDSRVASTLTREPTLKAPS